MTTNLVTQTPAGSAKPARSSSRWQDGLQLALFWGWNIFFLALMTLGFAPLELPRLINSIQEGITPAIYLVQSLIIIFIPVVATIIAVVFLRRDAERQFALGYVVEWPLMLILLVRFFVIREGNPAITVMLAWLALAELSFLWYLVDRRARELPAWQRYTRLAGLTLLFAGTLYSAFWLLFYVPPLASALWDIIKNSVRNFTYLFNNTDFRQWYMIPLSILGQLVFLLSLSLILVMPVAAPILAARAWLRSLRASLDSAVEGTRRVPAVLAATLLPLALVLVVLGLNMRQPQQAAFALLEKPPATPQQAQALIKQEDQIRAGLVNAYLGSYRYIGSMGEVNHIRDIYRWSVGMDSDTAWRVEQVYERVIQPFLYQPVHAPNPDSWNSLVMRSEQAEAARYYERYFDEPIATGEREAIVNAVRYTPDGAVGEAAWQAVDDREVRLNRQEVTVSEHGDWAEVMLHEAYENRTNQRQEVLYYFSLPESAVITGLWLGNTPNREDAFVFQVAPRGAAQQLYRNEVRYFHDPALVEQIGPRQYRLRAFPVEPRTWDLNIKDYAPGPELNLWISYRVMLEDEGWPLPQLAEKRNVYWDKNSVRVINGADFPAAEKAWLPANIAASGEALPAAHRVDFADGMSVVAVPAAQFQAADLPAGLRVAVVLDRSFSMRDRAGEVSQAFTSLKQAFGAAEPDVYLTASEYRGEQPARLRMASFDPSQVLYIGGQNAAELLGQFQALSQGETYDMILALTDGSGYELGDGGVEIAVPDAPLWVVHLGGGFPLGYDDATQQAIQASGGGIAGSVDEALARYAASREMPGRFDTVDGYTWQTLPTAEIETLNVERLSAAAETDGFTAIAARRWMLAEMAKNKGQLQDLPVLDQLHALAVEQGIVTPYSSMIVLVNEAQRRRLEDLSEQADRYAREVEDIGLTDEAGPLAVTGVPEPEEWLLLFLAAALLLYANRERIKTGITRLGNHGVAPW